MEVKHLQIPLIFALTILITSCSKDESPKALRFLYKQEVVIDTAKEMLKDSPQYDYNSAIEAHSQLEERLRNSSVDIEKDIYLIFRYRYDQIIPELQKLINENPGNQLLPLWFINTVTQMDNPDLLKYIKPYTHSKNDILREYAYNSFGFLGTAGDTALLDSALASEKNGYVYKTIECARSAVLRGNYKNRISYLPQYFDTNLLKIKFLYLGNSSSYPDRHTTKEYPWKATYPKTCQMIFPTQQFYYPLKYAPTSGFFGNATGNSYHVGYDGAWAFEGLPVHSISNGVVRLVSHSLSWGNLIAVESIIAESDTVTVLYGHLSRYIDVKPGDIVSVGDKIGQIGNSVSFENGGYWSHLHLGIIKESYENAKLVGYDSNPAGYYDPVDLIKGRE